MNTTPYLRHKVSPPIPKMPQETNNESLTNRSLCLTTMTELTPDLYEQVLEYYRHKNEYFPD